MPVIESQYDPNSAISQQQGEELLARIAEWRELEGKQVATEQKAAAKFAKRGQLLPRERVNRLLDRGSPFLEISTLCGLHMHDDKDGSLASGNLIIGIGYVAGVRCMVSCTNSAIKGGTMTPMGVQKSLRAQEVAMKQKLPVVSLVESGGANLNYQVDLFIPGGATFANQARLSAAGIPQITVVHGSSTAGGAYMPGLSDYTIMVRKRAKVFLAGPPLLKAATGEIASDEELGGADMHAGIAGTTEWVAENDADGIRMAREAMEKLGWQQTAPSMPMADYDAPKYDIGELVGLVPADYRKPYDAREVIARVVDGSDFLEFKNEYDNQTICGQASICGQPVGIITNNGPITPQGATKAAQFIQLCCQANRPLIFLQNTTGYMVGTDAEQNGIVKHGSKMLQAVANATVPKLTIVMGGSFGAGNYGMCGRGLSPDFIFAWPNSRTAVMGGEQAAKVMAIVTEQKMAAMGKEMPAPMLEAMQQKIIDQFDKDSDPFNCSARIFDDGIIDPRDTRKVLAMCLSVTMEARAREVQPNTFGVARL